jgi:hypothetical protein
MRQRRISGWYNEYTATGMGAKNGAASGVVMARHKQWLCSFFIWTLTGV